MRRRTLLAATLALAGCASPFAPDADGDGVPDRSDAAPSDPRADEWVRGDPPPSVRIAPVGRPSNGTAAVRVTHEAGDAFTAGNTGRLELAAGGTSVATLALPFAVGDERVVRGVPVGQRVVLLWVSPDGDDVLVVAAGRVDPAA